MDQVPLQLGKKSQSLLEFIKKKKLGWERDRELRGVFFEKK